MQVGDREGQCKGQCKVEYKQESTDIIEEILTDPKDKNRLMIYGRFRNGID